MKRLASLLLALAAALLLPACGQGGPDLVPGSWEDGEPGLKQGVLGDTLSTQWFDFTVDGAYSCARYGSYTAADGNKLVVATLTLNNTFGSPVDMWGDDFAILWDDPDQDSGAAPALPEGISGEQFPDEYVLAIDEVRTGQAVYEVPQDFSDFALAFQEIFEDTENPDNLDGVEGDTFLVSFTAEEK